MKMASKNTKSNLQRGDIICILNLSERYYPQRMIYEGNIGNKEAFLDDGYMIDTLKSWRFAEIEINIEREVAKTDFTKAELFIYKKGTKEFDDNCGLVLKLKETTK